MSVTRGTQHSEQSGSGLVTPQSSPTSGEGSGSGIMPAAQAVAKFILPVPGKVCIETMDVVTNSSPSEDYSAGFAACQQTDGNEAQFSIPLGTPIAWTVSEMAGLKSVSGQLPAFAAGDSRTIMVPTIPEDKPATFDSLPNFGAIAVLGGLAVGILAMNMKGGR